MRGILILPEFCNIFRHLYTFDRTQCFLHHLHSCNIFLYNPWSENVLIDMESSFSHFKLHSESSIVQKNKEVFESVHKYLWKEHFSTFRDWNIILVRCLDMRLLKTFSRNKTCAIKGSKIKNASIADFRTLLPPYNVPIKIDKRSVITRPKGIRISWENAISLKKLLNSCAKHWLQHLNY